MRPQTKFGIALTLALVLVGAFVISVRFGNDSSRDRDDNATDTDRTTPSKIDTEEVETPREPSARESAMPGSEVPAARPARKDPSLNVKAFQSPEEYIELLRTFPYAFAKAVQPLGQDAVQPLLAILDDPEYMRSWNRVSFAIVLVDREHESSEALLRYIRRNDDWRAHLREDQLGIYVLGKIAAVGRLGLVADHEALDVVKSALTVEGARTLVGEWFDDCASRAGIGGPDVLVALIQGNAARAMVHAGDAEGIRRVEDLHALLSSTKETSVPETTDVETLEGELIIALAKRDLIRDVGMEKYLEISANSYTSDYVLEPYEAKYKQEN